MFLRDTRALFVHETHALQIACYLHPHKSHMLPVKVIKQLIAAVIPGRHAKTIYYCQTLGEANPKQVKTFLKT